MNISYINIKFRGFSSQYSCHLNRILVGGHLLHIGGPDRALLRHHCKLNLYLRKATREAFILIPLSRSCQLVEVLEEE